MEKITETKVIQQRNLVHSVLCLDEARVTEMTQMTLVCLKCTGYLAMNYMVAESFRDAKSVMSVTLHF